MIGVIKQQFIVAQPPHINRRYMTVSMEIVIAPIMSSHHDIVKIMRVVAYRDENKSEIVAVSHGHQLGRHFTGGEAPWSISRPPSRIAVHES